MKIFLIFFLLLGTLTFAHKGDHPYGITETKIENKAQLQKVIENKNYEYEIEYDVDIYKEEMTFEIEIEGYNEPKLNISKTIKDILTIVSEEAPDVKEVYITILFDPEKGNERLLYGKTHYIKK